MQPTQHIQNIEKYVNRNFISIDEPIPECLDDNFFKRHRKSILRVTTLNTTYFKVMSDGSTKPFPHHHNENE